ncbi:MAG: hypothetical protein NZ899_00055 [Thermoguttaceae bacterium]|nr:hypothetical protein [Thermoguttaceae bacterium]MDW8077289.1 hypothetical protein [Thermoguttaceae bacterium]
MNFFEWIRLGVRRAVLLGVADAVGDIGKPPESEDISRRLLDLLRQQPSTAVAASEAPQITYAPKRRRLGRSLNEIQGLAEEAE